MTPNELKAQRAAERERWKQCILSYEDEFYSWDVWRRMQPNDRTLQQFLSLLQPLLRQMEKDGLLRSRVVEGAYGRMRRYFRKA